MSRQSLKLSELARQIEDVIHHSFGANYFWVIAEISGHKYYPNNDRHYLDLIEKIEGSSIEAARVKAKAWTDGSRNIAKFEEITGQKFENGLSVLVQVRIEYHIVHGLSVTIYDVDPNFTLGNIARQRQQVLQTLLASESEHIQLVDGEYVTRNKRLHLPVVLQNIALIASPNSEGYTDFIHTLNNNNQGYKFNTDIYYSSVQGRDAEKELVETFLKIHASGVSYDCVVLIRGGGARTDFLVFDTYSLSRIVARFPIPVITGIGHHNDVSIVDMMAHTSTKTPTQSAEFIIDCNRRFETEVIALQHMLTIRTQQVLKSSTSHLALLQNVVGNRSSQLFRKYADSLQLTRHSVHVASLSRLSSQSHMLVQFKNDLFSMSIDQLHGLNELLKEDREELILNLERLFKKKKEELNQQSVLMKIADPERVLKRGFAMIRKANKVIVDSAEIKENDEIELIMDKEILHTVVKSKEKTNGNKAEL